MSFPVQRQVVGAAERPVARLAHERLGARVFAHVARQLVGAGEAPVAVLPGAEVRLLTWEQDRRGQLRRPVVCGFQGTVCRLRSGFEGISFCCPLRYTLVICYA